jgi:hypothetical protein
MDPWCPYSIWRNRRVDLGASHRDGARWDLSQFVQPSVAHGRTILFADQVYAPQLSGLSWLLPCCRPHRWGLHPVRIGVVGNVVSHDFQYIIHGISRPEGCLGVAREHAACVIEFETPDTWRCLIPICCIGPCNCRRQDRRWNPCPVFASSESSNRSYRMKSKTCG